MQPERQIHIQFSFVADNWILYMAQHVFVVTFIANGDNKSWPHMQSNAYTPKISLRTDTGYGTYRWYKIEHLQFGPNENGK